MSKIFFLKIEENLIKKEKKIKTILYLETEVVLHYLIPSE